MNKVTEYLKQFVRVPSCVGNGHDESAMTEAVLEPLASLKGHWKITESIVAGNRKNVFVTNSDDPKLLFAAHMDTVPPSAAWSRDPFAADVEDGRLYGLGAVDMKAGLAAIVDTLIERQDTKVSCAALFYVGEEYDFCGMKKFVAETDIQPETIIVPEPTDLKVYQGCRAVFQGVMVVIGKTGHSAMSTNAINAIMVGLKAMSALEQRLVEEKDERLGRSTLNVAGSRGGVQQEDQVLVKANMVPDYARIDFSVRASTPLAADSEFLESFVRQELEKRGAKLESIDFSLKTGLMKALTLFDGLSEFERGDESQFGYTDLEMLVSAQGGSPVVCGPGPMSMAHCPDEYVELDELERLTTELKKLL